MSEKINIIYNDDLQVIEFLSDLENRSPIHVLDESMQENKDMKGCLATQHTHEGIISLLLFNDPFGYNEGGNKLTLFSHTDLSKLIQFFSDWIRQTSYIEITKRNALRNIIHILSECSYKIEMQNTQTNFMG